MNFASKDFVEDYINSLQIALGDLRDHSENIKKISGIVIDALAHDKKVLICGNGGSAAQSQHFAAELVGQFRLKRSPLAAIALNTDSSVVTSLGNDFGFEEIFAKQVAALGSPRDVLVCISTSGRSRNVIRAAEQAADQNMKVLSLIGANGSELERLSELTVNVGKHETAITQELHMTCIHLICGGVDSHFASSG